MTTDTEAVSADALAEYLDELDEADAWTVERATASNPGQPGLPPYDAVYSAERRTRNRARARSRANHRSRRPHGR